MTFTICSFTICSFCLLQAAKHSAASKKINIFFISIFDHFVSECKITTFFSNIQKSRVEKELFYFYSLYIICRSVVLYVENAILNDLCTLYIVTLYIYREVFCSLPFLKTDGDVS